MHIDIGSEFRVRAGSLNLAAKRWGNSQNPEKILSIHGWLHNANSFDRLAPMIGLQKMDLVSLDLAGHGFSEHRHLQASYDFVNWLADTASVIRSLGWEQFSLLGHSLGAAIAICTAAILEVAVKKVILLDGLGPMSMDPKGAPSQLMRAFRDRERKKTIPEYISEAHALKHLLASDQNLNLEAAQILISRSLKQTEQSTFTWRYDPRLRHASLQGWTEPQVIAYLRRVRCPVLLIRPDSGWPVDENQFTERINQIRDIHVQKVPGNHHIHLIKPASISEIISRFLHC